MNFLPNKTKVEEFHVLFICSGGSDLQPSPIVTGQLASIVKKNISVEVFLIKSGIFNYIKSIFQLRKCLAEAPLCNILHAHYGWCGLVACLARKKEQKLIVSFMGDDLVGVVGQNGRYTFSGKLVAGLNRLLAGHVYDYVIVKSKALKRHLKKRNNVTVIPNGVDIEAFFEMKKAIARQKIGLAEDKRYIIFVSNPSRPEKNYKLAEQAVQMLEYPAVELLALSCVPHQELVFYYNAADCLVLPSIHEGSPNVIKEAMACNCPIVSTDVGDVRWVFGRTSGCFIASSDPLDFADKIRSALDFSKYSGRTRGRERILDLGLDAGHTANKIIDIYHKVAR